ncbi:MAG: hypothetical protein HOV79_14710 [Hamadaea sp.]|nr:hypothetical protein [Hamadaea sp.]
MRLTALALLVDVVALGAGAGAYPDRVADAVRRSGVDDQVAGLLRGFATALPIVVIAISLIAAGTLLVLAATVARGSFAGPIGAGVGVITVLALGTACVLLAPPAANA